jgi:hypothetical protein
MAVARNTPALHVTHTALGRDFSLRHCLYKHRLNANPGSMAKKHAIAWDFTVLVLTRIRWSDNFLGAKFNSSVRSAPKFTLTAVDGEHNGISIEFVDTRH